MVPVFRKGPRRGLLSGVQVSLRPGFAVFPLYPVQEGGACGCGNVECKASGKHPAYAYSTLKKGERVQGRAGCGYGIATGERSGFFALDFDNLESLKAMEEDPARPLPTTAGVWTARGVHLYFKQPAGVRVKNSASELAPGVDVRGEGGFVVAPGSQHKSGAVYAELKPEGLAIADAPAWLLEWPGLQAQERATTPAGDNAPVPVDVNTPEGKIRVGLAHKYLETCQPAGDDSKGVRWALALYLVRDLELSVDDAMGAIALSGYTERCTPPWEPSNVRHKLEDARDKSDRMPGAITMAGFMERAASIGAQAADARREERQVAVTPDAPHQYTFDPANVVRELQFAEAEDGSKKVKKPYKPDIDELVFDLNTEESWAGVFRYNEFDDRIYAFRPPFRMTAEHGAARLMDEDLTGMRVWFLNRKYASAKAEDIASAVNLIAHRSPYHPVRDWLGAMPEPTTRHLDTLAAVLFGDERPIAQVYVRKSLVAACARAMQPGCRVDTVLTLVGPKGGEKKSTTIEELHRVPGCSVFRTDLPDLRDFQKVGQALEGVWVAELPELAVIRKGDVETVKATLTRRTERYSPKYVKGEVNRPRGCVFWGSTNEEEFLPKADPAFRRRFWPVIMGKRADMTWLSAHREEIWAEAMALYKAGEAWWFEDEDEADAGRAGVLVEDSWEQMVAEAIARLTPLKDGIPSRFLTAKDVYTLSQGLDARPPSDIDFKKVHAAMAGLGYEKRKREGVRGWVIPLRQAQ